MSETKTMNPAVWQTWTEFRTSIWEKKVIFFGVSTDWASKTLAQSDIALDCIVDNSPSWLGSHHYDVEVKSPEILKTRSDDTYVVITSGAYESIYPQLVEYGLEPGKEFCITPALGNLRVITEIHAHDARLLISSPDHKIYSELDKDSNVGGGLYVYGLQERSCEKKLSGTFHEIVDAGDVYYVAEESKGIFRISKDFEVLDTFGAEAGMKCHGIAYSPERNIVCLACTGLDKVVAYDAGTRKKLFDVKLTDKVEKTGRPFHWLNDLHIRDNFLYVSLFSHSGSQLNGVYDGGILRIDLDDLDRRDVLIRDAWMPHTVRFFDSQICFLDSMNGHFYRTSKNVVGEFNGFVRGLAFDGRFYYIGQSETRYFDRLRGMKKHIAMSAGFYLFDEDTKAAKFFCTPQIRQIHDVCYIGNP